MDLLQFDLPPPYACGGATSSATRESRPPGTTPATRLASTPDARFTGQWRGMSGRIATARLAFPLISQPPRAALTGSAARVVRGFRPRSPHRAAGEAVQPWLGRRDVDVVGATPLAGRLNPSAALNMPLPVPRRVPAAVTTKPPLRGRPLESVPRTTHKSWKLLRSEGEILIAGVRRRVRLAVEHAPRFEAGTVPQGTRVPSRLASRSDPRLRLLGHLCAVGLQGCLHVSSLGCSNR